MVSENRGKSLLKEMPEKLRDEVEHHMRNLTIAKVEILDYRKVVSTPYKDKEKKDVNHEAFLEYGNLFILLTLRERTAGINEEVYKECMNLGQVKNFIAKSIFFDKEDLKVIK